MISGISINLSMLLHIKNMVCERCKLVVGNELQRIGLSPRNIQLGEVELDEETLSERQLEDIRRVLGQVGFELLDDKRGRLIEQIKAFVIRQVHHGEAKAENIKFSDAISRALHHSYSYLSSLFSSVEGMTLEQYIIHQKIERVKELLMYDELSLSQIAFDLDYSSTAHLSNQFRRITGMTPSTFRKSGKPLRRGLDEVST